MEYEQNLKARLLELEEKVYILTQNFKYLELKFERWADAQKKDEDYSNGTDVA